MDDGTTPPIRPGTVITVASTLTASPCSTSPTQAASSATALMPNIEVSTPRETAANGICVFSGGTAANSLVDAFQAVAAHLSSGANARLPGEEDRGEKKQPCSLAYIIPISDNGGSSSELIRFFGGPSVGDIRSRLVRLIPTSDDEKSEASASGEGGGNPSSTNERAALRSLFEYRLCASDPNQARSEWLELVEARHLLWTFVPSATRELIRAVLNTLNLEIVKRARPSTSVFNFAAASVGNLFLTGARLFSGSFEAAIYLLSLLCGIPDHVAVLPAINSNFTHHISAGLADGTTIAGQVNISHPSAPTSLPDGGPPTVGGGVEGGASGAVNELPPPGPVSIIRRDPRTRERASTAVDFEDATLPGSLPALRRPQIAFSKEDEEDLPARISRVWYINPYGHEIRPQANPKALTALRQAEAVIYSIGSLYTSIIPSLVLRGVGAAIAGVGESSDGKDGAGREFRRKVLILNSKLDRETGPSADPMTAVDFVRAIVGACKQSQSDFSAVHDSECRRYVTHIVYLEKTTGQQSGAGAPKVDSRELSRLGLRCVAVPSEASQQMQGEGKGNGAVANKKAMERYDQAALTRALEQLLDGTWDRRHGV